MEAILFDITTMYYCYCSTVLRTAAVARSRTVGSAVRST